MSWYMKLRLRFWRWGAWCDASRCGLRTPWFMLETFDHDWNVFSHELVSGFRISWGVNPACTLDSGAMFFLHEYSVQDVTRRDDYVFRGSSASVRRRVVRA